MTVDANMTFKFMPFMALPFLAAAGTAALAETVFESSSGGSIKFYGQIDPAVTSFDDGSTKTTQFSDSGTSRSRVGLRFEQPFDENEVRVLLETSLGLGQSGKFSQTRSPEVLKWERTELRRADFQFETARLGTFYFGQGSMASDGTGDLDMSGTVLGASVAIADPAGSFRLRKDTGELSNIEIGDIFPNYDGSRRGRIRYDSPKFAGFALGVAYGEDILSKNNNDKFHDIGLSYGVKLESGVKLDAGAGHAVRTRSGARDRKDTFASMSALFPSGFNITLGVGNRNTAGHYGYVKFGYIRDYFSVGATAFSADFYAGYDANSKGDSAKSFGLALVQKFDDQNIEAYLGYRNYAYSDTSATSFQDAASYIIGARWRF